MTKARDNATQGGLVLLNTTTVSAASTITFNNIFSSDYDNYKITWVGLGSTAINLRVAFGSTTTGYYSANMDFRSSASAPTTQGASANGAIGNIGAVWSAGGSFEMNIYNPNKTLVTTWQGIYTTSEAATTGIGEFGGSLQNNTSYTSCTITTHTGTITGTIRVYGIRN